MIHRIAFIAAGCLALAAPAAAQAPAEDAAPAVSTALVVGDANTQGVAAIVNDYVITDYDVNQRMALFVVTAGIEDTSPETLEQIRGQVLRTLQDEILQLEEANERMITLTSVDVDMAIEDIARENGITVAQIMETMQRAGVTQDTFRRQITANLAWNRLIEARYAGAVTISDEQVDAAMQRLEGGANRPQFAVSEIVFNLDSPQDEARVKEAADQIMVQLRRGAVFQNVARQVSQAASAGSGGDIGWVQQGQLANELDQALLELQPGEIAGPLRAEGGYYILLLRDRREPAGTEPVEQRVVDPNAPVPLNRLLLQLPPGAPQEFQQQAMNFAGQIAGAIGACGDLVSIAEQTPGTVLMNLGEVRLETLAPQLADAIRSTPPGEVVPPFMSQVGVEVFVRCDERLRTVTPFVMPSRDELQQQLFLQQMNVLARSYLRDLRRDAVIEVR